MARTFTGSQPQERFRDAYFRQYPGKSFNMTFFGIWWQLREKAIVWQVNLFGQVFTTLPTWPTEMLLVTINSLEERMMPSELLVPGCLWQKLKMWWWVDTNHGLYLRVCISFNCCSMVTIQWQWIINCKGSVCNKVRIGSRLTYRTWVMTVCWKHLLLVVGKRMVIHMNVSWIYFLQAVLFKLSIMLLTNKSLLCMHIAKLWQKCTSTVNQHYHFFCTQTIYTLSKPPAALAVL